jgi:hypothetical protein
LLDQEFLHAYNHGIVLKCADGLLCRIFPCIFIYSADHPEKFILLVKMGELLTEFRVLIATIKDMGSCLCPCCFTPKSMFAYLGLLQDMRNHINNLRVYVVTNIVKAQELIYFWGITVDSAKVEETLGEGSWVPIIVSANCPLLSCTGSDE